MSLLLENENLIQFIKYALAGGLATLCHILLFNLLAWKMFPALQANDPVVKLLHINIAPINDFHRARNSMISNFLAFMVANLVAYITNILWVFEGGRHSFFIEILLFYAVSGISMVIGTSFMGLLIKRFGVMTTYAFGTNIITAVMINYAVRKFFIFQG
ncbi:GtrA family protein [Desulforhopalus sp. 52FAK]